MSEMKPCLVEYLELLLDWLDKRDDYLNAQVTIDDNPEVLEQLQSVARAARQKMFDWVEALCHS